jgi:SCP1.201-like deaminase
MATALESTRITVDVAVERCEQAATAADTGRSIADDKIQWAQRMGLPALGEGMQQVTDALTEATSGWVAAHTAVTAASTALNRLPQTRHRDDVLGHVDAAVEQLGQASAAATAATAKIGEANAVAAQAGSASVTRVVAEAAAVAGDATAAIDTAARTVAEFRCRLHAVFADTTPTPGSGRAPVVAPGRPFKPMRTDPDKRDEIQPYVGLDYAVATLWDGDGNRILGPHSAGDDGPARERARDLKEPWRSSPRLLRHIEGHAAARMRADRRRTAVLYLNMRPCTYPNGCHPNLEALLPEGYELVVHQVRPRGDTKVRRYKGTGAALQNPEEFR